MSDTIAKTNIEEIANMLREQREKSQQPVLFLGSRAGGLFGNEVLYETLKQFSLLNFEKLSNEEQFAECYKAIAANPFSISEIQSILVGALSFLSYREEDKFLVDLINSDFFAGVISTNIDTLLEDAYSVASKQEIDKYRILLLDDETVQRENISGQYIIKAFGSITSLRYRTAKNELNLQEEAQLRVLLETQLAKDVLILGYDPIWDKPIEQAFLAQGGRLWYVNTQASPSDTLLLDPPLKKALEQRNGKKLQSYQGSYNTFIRILYSSLRKDIKQSQRVTSQASSKPVQGEKKIVISYSHKDQAYFDRLKTYLRASLPLTEKRSVEDIVWDDTTISPGTNWQQEIEKALTQAKAAILLVSSSFLSSQQASDSELNIILQAANSGEVKLFPVMLDATTLSSKQNDMMRSLNHYQIVNSVTTPLKGLESYEQDIIWDKLVEQIYHTLSSQ